MTFISRHTRLNALSDVYFWFYLTLLTIRTGLMLYAVAGSIFESTRMPLQYIWKFSEKNWCVDVRMI